MNTHKINVTIIFSLLFAGICYYIFQDKEFPQQNLNIEKKEISEIKIKRNISKTPLNSSCCNNFNYETVKLGLSSLSKETQIDSLPIVGKIPEWLSGTLYRNGPGLFETEKEEIETWYDGLAMIHKFTIENGKVSYLNKFLQSDDYCNKKRRPAINNANVNICKIANQIVALAETPKAVVIDECLNTVGAFKYDDKLPQDKVYESAHPHFDKNKNEMINYLVNYGCFSSSYDIYKLQIGTKEREQIASISVKEPAFMHSFAITENYIILTEYPFIVNPMNLMLTDEFIEKFQWKPNRGTNFHLIDRNSGQVRKLNTEAFFSFHHVNAFQEDNKIILDLIAYKDPSIISKAKTIEQKLNRIKFHENLVGRLTRFIIDLNQNIITKSILCEDMIEVPRINEDFDGKPYQYIYAAGIKINDNYLDELNHLIKLNTKNCESKKWSSQNCYPGEPVFVPNPNGKNEDDGVVLSVVLDGSTKKSFLLILDATTFKELARAQLPHHMPFGFHGQFYAKENNGK